MVEEGSLIGPLWRRETQVARTSERCIFVRVEDVRQYLGRGILLNVICLLFEEVVFRRAFLVKSISQILSRSKLNVQFDIRYSGLTLQLPLKVWIHCDNYNEPI